MFLKNFPVKYRYFDNEDPPVDPPDNDPPIDPPTPTPPEKKQTTFTQEDVNRFLADERRKVQKQNERTIKELQTLKQNAQLTVEEKERLETRIENLQNEYLSKEELSKKSQKKIQEEQKAILTNLEKDRDRWRELYTTSTIERQLLDAAVEHKAYNPQQVMSILTPNTRLVEELDESGQPTGNLVPKTKFRAKDKDGKTVTLDLAVTEAVKQMTEMPEQYGNLFNSGATSGLGNLNVRNPGKSTNPPTDPAAYKKWREENKHLVS